MEPQVFISTDIAPATVTRISGLDTKNHSFDECLRLGQGLDTSDRDGKINIANLPVKGSYLPNGTCASSANSSLFMEDR